MPNSIKNIMNSADARLKKVKNLLNQAKRRSGPASGVIGEILPADELMLKSLGDFSTVLRKLIAENGLAEVIIMEDDEAEIDDASKTGDTEKNEGIPEV